MPSQTDLDQGGTFRQTQLVYLGPSVGWVRAAQQVVLPITTSGTTNVAYGNSLITINVNGNVTVQLPIAKAPGIGAGAQPGPWTLTPIVIADVGGLASVNTYTIKPAGAELIDGLASVQLVSNFGAFILKPILETGGWTLIQ